MIGEHFLDCHVAALLAMTADSFSFLDAFPGL
jgi:hypothetical protein